MPKDPIPYTITKVQKFLKRRTDKLQYYIEQAKLAQFNKNSGI
jgi:hypothetical protein